MRRLLLLNALIFAVLAAAAALAYYGFSATTDTSDRERALMRDLAEEKVLNIESLIDDADTKLMREVKLDDMSGLHELPKTTGAAIINIYVLDDKLEILPSGSATFQPKEEAKNHRDWFMTKVLPQLPFGKAKLNERGHYFFYVNDKPNLFSFMRRESGGRMFYVVVEDDVSNHLIGRLFPQFFFLSDSSKRLYKVVDERGGHRDGAEFEEGPEVLTVSVDFTQTLDGWKLKVAQKNAYDQAALRRKLIINSLLVGGAVTVILGGLAVLGFALRRARRLSELKSEFISNVSHELKTPLSIISMFGEMLANGRTKSPEQAHEYAEIIWRESVRLGRLIDNVLDFAKIERGMDVYEFDDDVDITEVVERAIELSNRRVAAAEMTLEHEIEPDLPNLRLDANAFTLAVLNLIDNAIKYAADGKKIALSLKRRTSRTHPPRVVLSVRDWGPGIDREEQEAIFERFYRARAIRLKPIRGSGIGLALCRHIARAHGGDVMVDSKPGHGSTFSIWIPIDGKK